jgi:hypothetical protein
VLFEVDFVYQTFPKKAHIAVVLASQISKLIFELARKTPSRLVVIPAKVGLFRRSLLTDAQNVFLQGSPKLVSSNQRVQESAVEED